MSSQYERPASREELARMREATERHKSIKEMQKRCTELAAIAAERESAQILQLPLWHQGRRGSPNSLARSALFAAAQYKLGRILVKDEVVFSQQNLSVKYTGEQLNQEDMTVWLALVDLARVHPLGTECNFTAYGILKHLGLKNGGAQSERLRLSVERMTACMVKIETSKFIYGGSLVEKFIIDKNTKHYKLTLNRDLIKLFGDNDWTALSWEQRKQLRSKPLAQKLHEYYSSHECPLPLTIEFLHDISGSNTKEKFKFKQSLKSAFDALVIIGFLEGFKFEGDKVTVERKHRRSLSART